MLCQMKWGRSPPKLWPNSKVTEHVGKCCCGLKSSELKLSCASVEPPSFTKRVDNVTAVLGKPVKLQGTVKGSSPITVKWMKDSEYLKEDDPSITLSFENNVASLSIATVALSHGGKYLCQAENEAGQQKSEATLTVQGQLASSMPLKSSSLSFS